MEATQQIVFSVGEGEYSMDVSQVIAIESLNHVVMVPNTSNYILGIVNLRGEILPIYSLRSKFGLEEVPTDERTKIIVTKSNGVAVAFKVDAVKEIIECGPGMLLEFPDVARNEHTTYIGKVAHKDGRIILLIDQNQLIKEEEGEEISRLVNSAARDF